MDGERGIDMFPFYVVIYEAKNLRLVKSELPCPYLSLEIKKFKVNLKSRNKNSNAKTKVLKDTRNPEWNEIHSFQYIDITETFTIECHDEKSGEFLGEVKFKGRMFF